MFILKPRFPKIQPIFIICAAKKHALGLSHTSFGGYSCISKWVTIGRCNNALLCLSFVSGFLPFLYLSGVVKGTGVVFDGFGQNKLVKYRFSTRDFSKTPNTKFVAKTRVTLTPFLNTSRKRQPHLTPLYYVTLLS